MSQVIRNIIMVVTKPKYALSMSLISLGIFSTFIFVNNISLFSSAYDATKDVWLLGSVFISAVEMISDVGGIGVIVSAAVVSSLGGLSIAILIYKIKNVANHSKGSLFSFGGLFGGALSSTCPACSTALISALGVAGGLSMFPFKGFEISTISIAILLASIYFAAKNIDVNNICKLGQKNRIKN